MFLPNIRFEVNEFLRGVHLQMKRMRRLGAKVTDKWTVRSDLAENAWVFFGGELWGVRLACAQEV